MSAEPEESANPSDCSPWSRLLGVTIVAGSVLFAASLLRQEDDVTPTLNPPVAGISHKVTVSTVFESIVEPDKSTKTGQSILKAKEQVIKSPENAVAWTTLGDALAQEMRNSGDEKYYAAAEMAYHEALRIKPKLTDALTGMAWVFGGRHQFDISILWAKEALSVDEKNPAALGIYGDAAVETGDYDMAFEQYQKMIDARPDLSSWSRGAHLMALTGNRSGGVILMQKAVRAGAPFAENTDWCRANLAMMNFNSGALIPAMQVLAPSLEAGSRNVHVLLAAGRFATACKDYTAAEGYYGKVLLCGPNYDALVGLGDIQVLQGSKDKAEVWYAKVEALHQANLANGNHSHMNVAKFYADHDRNLPEALKIIGPRKDSRNVTEADIVAWVYFKNGDQPHAIAAMKRALHEKTSDAEFEFHAGMIAAKSGDLSSAGIHLQAALSINPNFNPLLSPVAYKMLDEIGSRPVISQTAPVQPLK